LNQPKSIFRSKSVQGGLITLISSLVIIGVNCGYENRTPNKEEALTGVGFIVAFSWTLVGRGANTPVYTPNILPGANRKDFEVKTIQQNGET
jgi:hypothetical protein